MFHKLCEELSPRVEKIVTDLQAFGYEVINGRPGKTGNADYMSREKI